MAKFKLSYIIPNLITASSIFVAILSILYSFKGEFENAIYMILLSAIFDVLDGKVARMTNSQSKFGFEFDSLADVIAFGVAPSMLIYFSVGHQYGKYGILATSVLVIFGAIRLAKYNSVTHKASVFLGLPIPAGAIFISSYTYMLMNYKNGEYLYLMLFIAIAVSILMVTNIRYPSLKQELFAKQYTFRVLVLVLIILSLIYIYTMQSIFVAISIYAFWGLFKLIYNILKRKVVKKERK